MLIDHLSLSSSELITFYELMCVISFNAFTEFMRHVFCFHFTEEQIVDQRG